MAKTRPAWTFPVAAFVGAAMLRALRLTWRIDERPLRCVTARRGIAPGAPGTIYLMWHSRILLGAATQADLGLSVLISQHGDGEYIARTVERLGFRCVRGSTTRGGARALLAILDILRGGGDVAFTPDGPKGPRLRVQQGCVAAASATGAPIVAVGFECSRTKRFRSWDRFMLPAPFTKVAVRFGEPIAVPPDLDQAGLETWRGRAEAAMHSAQRAAADAIGVAAETE